MENLVCTGVFLGLWVKSEIQHFQPVPNASQDLETLLGLTVPSPDTHSLGQGANGISVSAGKQRS